MAYVHVSDNRERERERVGGNTRKRVKKCERIRMSESVEETKQKKIVKLLDEEAMWKSE